MKLVRAGWRKVVRQFYCAIAKKVFLLNLHLLFKLLARDFAFGKTPDDITVLFEGFEPEESYRLNPVRRMGADDQEAHLVGKKSFFRAWLFQLFEQAFLGEKGPGFLVIKRKGGFVWMIGKIHPATLNTPTAPSKS